MAPTTLLGLAVKFLGRTNIMKALDPIEAIIIGLLCILKKIRITNIAPAARRL